MQHICDLLRKLADFDPGDALVLSVYLDMCPHGDSPAIRPSQIFLKDRFRQIEKRCCRVGPHWTIFGSMRIAYKTFWMSMQYPWLQGVALFACNSHQLFEVIETGVPFENQVILDPVPDLFQLARLVDEQERNDLVRLATLSSAEVDLVTGHEILQQMGGVGALLRYRLSWV